jgi:c-di-GMP-related signal transduction protein
MPAATDIFVARQPIFDGRQHVYAYELLFRSGPEHYFSAGRTPDAQTSHVISNGMFVGLDSLTDGKPAFVTFCRESLVGDVAFVLPPKDIVVEIAEAVEVDEPVLAACRRLKAAGYRIALDGYLDVPSRSALTEFADFIKVDVLHTPLAECGAIARKYQSPPCRILAEHVETRDALRVATDQGFQYFQGFYFSRPTLVPSTTIPGFRLNYLRLLSELNRPEVDMRRLEAVVKQEASITYRLLRRVNSAAYGFRVETSSLRHALVLLGEREIRMCATVWALADLGRDQPAELVVTSTLRARFCEMLGPAARIADRTSDLFLVGMFSTLDAILGQPMDRILETLPLPDDVAAALVGTPNRLRSVLDCAVAYEQGRWDDAAATAAAAGIAEADLPSCYLEAVEWTREIFRSPA